MSYISSANDETRQFDRLALKLRTLLTQRYIKKRPKSVSEIKEIWEQTIKLMKDVDELDYTNPSIQFLTTVRKWERCTYWRFEHLQIDNPQLDYLKISKQVMECIIELAQTNTHIQSQFPEFQMDDELLSAIRKEVALKNANLITIFSKKLQEWLTIQIHDKVGEYSIKLFSPEKSPDATHSFSKICEILKELNAESDLLSHFFKSIRDHIIQPLLSNNYYMEFNDSYKMTRKQTIKVQMELKNIKFFKRFFTKFHQINKENKIFRYYFDKYLWLEFANKFFAGDYLFNLMNRDNFSETILPLYRDFNESMAGTQTLLDDKLSGGKLEDLRCHVINSLAKKYGQPCSVSEKLDITKLQLLNPCSKGHEETPRSINLIKQLELDEITDIDNVSICSSTFNLLELYWKEFNIALEQLSGTAERDTVKKESSTKKEMDESDNLGSPTAHYAIFSLIGLKHLLMSWVLSKRHNFVIGTSTTTTANQVLVDCQVLIWQIHESIAHTNLNEVLSMSILHVFGFDHTLYEIGRLGNDALEACINRTLESLKSVPVLPISNRYSLLSRFTSQKSTIFIRILDCFTQVFLSNDIQHPFFTDDKEHPDTDAPAYLDENNINKFVAFANFQLSEHIPRLQDLINKCSSAITSIGIHKLVALQQFSEANMKQQFLSKVDTRLLEAEVDGNIPNNKNYRHLLKSSFLFSSEEKQLIYRWFDTTNSQKHHTWNAFSEARSIEYKNNQNFTRKALMTT